MIIFENKYIFYSIRNFHRLHVKKVHNCKQKKTAVRISVDPKRFLRHMSSSKKKVIFIPLKSLKFVSASNLIKSLKIFNRKKLKQKIIQKRIHDVIIYSYTTCGLITFSFAAA